MHSEGGLRKDTFDLHPRVEEVPPSHESRGTKPSGVPEVNIPTTYYEHQAVGFLFFNLPHLVFGAYGFARGTGVRCCEVQHLTGR